ncbi:hypothetical protein OROMI_027467 [Orobanche minor]
MVRLSLGSETTSLINEDPAGLIYMLGIIVLSISIMSLFIIICGDNNNNNNDAPRPAAPGRDPDNGYGLQSPKVYKKNERKPKRKTKPKHQDEGHSRNPKSEADGGEPDSTYEVFSP